MIALTKYTGCFMGLALGDTLGAPYEGGILERLLWKLIAKTLQGKLRYTDDTQMSIDLAHSFIENHEINQVHLAKTFAQSYHWTRGYGPATGWILKNIKQGKRWQDLNKAKYKDGSLGNGAAMRAPIVALCSPHNDDNLNELVVKCSEITHAHPLAIEGAQLIAMATKMNLAALPAKLVLEKLLKTAKIDQYQNKLKLCSEFIFSDKVPSIYQLKSTLGNGMTALDSTVSAIYFAHKYQSFEQMHGLICQLGGDADTISAMAGALWGAAHGIEGLTAYKFDKLENSNQILDLAKTLHEIAYPSD